MLLLPQAEPVECKKAVALYKPEGGVDPSQNIKKIVNTYICEIYIAQMIRTEFPPTAKIQDGIWTVEGSLPRGMPGGLAIIRFCRSNGTVLSIMHEK
jgi:hypothetical protein